MTKFEEGQKVWVECIVKTLDPEDNKYDMAVRFGDREHDFTWLSSRESNILTEAPPQPKPPATVKLFGHTIFDLANCVHIGEIKHHVSPNEKPYYIYLSVIRGAEVSYTYFYFETKEEAEAARALIEKEVLKAKGIDDDQG